MRCIGEKLVYIKVNSTFSKNKNLFWVIEGVGFGGNGS